MIITYKSKTRSKINGSRKYLIFDTEKKQYSRNCSRMAYDGETVTSTTIKNTIEQLKKEGYIEKDFIY